ncbi:hypothetical protein [Undibacterium oligocarboniphilum]|uniref:Uncharacterized protein n=1 Tax=Undibacterium oligocarboniphilum TaxID=666702 RepID=A0A850QEV3_9BURK|nr:hypothetical protein [Undibacterium oligocarboniphilum]MBC3871422.1 hypothetical protein [Undibacterium oligocarboniphilum]NVO79002.1 hypothetical protein [Undibacterium oligocarboniphilum]
MNEQNDQKMVSQDPEHVSAESDIGETQQTDALLGGISEEEVQSAAKGFEELANAGFLTEEQAQEATRNIANIRKRYSDLSSQQQKKIIRNRVNSGVKMMDSTLPGSTAVVRQITLNHGSLKNLFGQFVPYLDRAIVNMRMFGEENFGKKNNVERLNALNEMVTTFYEKTQLALQEAEKLKNEKMAEMEDNHITPFNPSVPLPALLNHEIHIHSQLSMKHLLAYENFDKLLNICAWLEWNELRTPSEISKTIRPLQKMALDTGRRGYLTFVDLLHKRADKETTNDLSIAA